MQLHFDFVQQWRGAIHRSPGCGHRVTERQILLQRWKSAASCLALPRLHLVAPFPMIPPFLPYCCLDLQVRCQSGLELMFLWESLLLQLLLMAWPQIGLCQVYVDTGGKEGDAGGLNDTHAAYLAAYYGYDTT